MGVQVNKITNANIYVDGESLLGRASEIELPSIKQKMAGHEALGMIGELEFPSGVEKLEGKIKWNSFYSDVIKLIADPTKALKIQVRGNLEKHSADGLDDEVPVVAYLTIRSTSLPMGSFKQHDNVDQESDFAAYYAKMEIDGVELFEYDPMSNIYVVNGVDIREKYRSNLGI